jgi:hypothetical protein
MNPLVVEQFVVGHTFPLVIEPVPDTVIVMMIDEYVFNYGHMLHHDYIIPDAATIATVELLPSLITFGRLALTDGEEPNVTDAYADSNMATAIVAQLLLINHGWPSVMFSSYEGMQAAIRAAVDVAGEQL